MQNMKNTPLIVFSHLRWDFVYQRPQHLLARLARQRRVIFVEEPQHADVAEAYWERSEPEANVTVYRPRTNVREWGFHPAQIPVLQGMVKELMEKERLESYAIWCYTAMAVPLVEAIAAGAEAVVFDVMDELSAFKGAPVELLENERKLLVLSDVVFTGGPSLYRAKKDRHGNVHCFSSSVDAAHFGAARNGGGLEEPAEQAGLGHPRLGFYGVIDERLDIELLGAMAQAHPEWQIVMVGPVVKIDPASLPRLPNIHYFGQQSYAQLPKFLSGWDVCLLPFARNDATKFISPTKTLEYMAAEKPIVSTPITDVAEPYGDIVYLGATAAEFIAACERALSADATEEAAHVARMRQVLAQTSWDATVAAMDAAILRAQEKKAAARNGAKGPAAATKRPALQAEAEIGAVREVPVAVIGAGPTGLSAAYHLGEDALLIEQNERVGGWCRSIEDHGFTFDYAGHIMFSNDPYVHEMYQKLLGDNVHWQNREAWIFSKGVYTRYPFQGSLYGLPAEVITECVVGAIEARFGSIKTKTDENAKKLHGNGNGSLTMPQNGQPNGHKNGNGQSATNGNGHAAPACKSGNGVKDCCGDGILEAEATLGHQAISVGPGSSEPKNFEEFIYKVWGRGIAKHFAIPYNRKIWAVDLKEMETSWLGGRVPLPDLEEMIAGALMPSPPPMGPNARFGYPLRGGFQALMNGFLPYVKDRLLLQTRVVGISPRKHTLTLSNGQRVVYEQLISTMPLPVLIRMMGDEVPEEVRRAAAGLRHTSVRCVNIGVGRENITDKHWIYYPEDTLFHRIFVQGNASPHCNAPGGFGFTCELTYSPQKPLPCDGEDLIRRCIDDCIRIGFIRADDPIWCANQVDMPYAYVVYDHARPKNIATIRTWLAAQDVLLAGRYSEWEYYNSDHAFLAGRKAAEKVRALQEETRLADLAPRRRLRDRVDASDRAGRGWPASLPARRTTGTEVKEEL